MDSPRFFLSVGRDYSVGALADWYEYLVWRDDDIVARKGAFTSYAAAKRAGLRAADALVQALLVRARIADMLAAHGIVLQES